MWGEGERRGEKNKREDEKLTLFMMLFSWKMCITTKVVLGGGGGRKKGERVGEIRKLEEEKGKKRDKEKVEDGRERGRRREEKEGEEREIYKKGKR